MQVIFSKIELEIPPFLTVMQFYDIISYKNLLARAHKKFQCGQHSETYVLTLKEQDKTKMELALDMVSISASICRTISEILKDKVTSHLPNLGYLKSP